MSNYIFPKRLLFFYFLIFSCQVYAEKRVLITAFEPFGGAEVNSSLIIAKQIQAKLALENISVDICLLPVVYDEAAQEAKKCYEALTQKPDMVLSLGEGGCNLRMETASQNRDSTPGFPDNKGNIRTGQIIDKSQPESLPFSSFILNMYCSIPKEKRRNISVSESPGGFVCNNTAFNLARFFEPLKIAYSFIHVPAASCENKSSKLAQEAGTTLGNMIQRFFAPPSPRKSFKTPACSQSPLLPTSLSQWKDFMDILKKTEDTHSKECRNEFMTKLKKRLELWKPKESTY